MGSPGPTRRVKRGVGGSERRSGGGTGRVSQLNHRAISGWKQNHLSVLIASPGCVRRIASSTGMRAVPLILTRLSFSLITNINISIHLFKSRSLYGERMANAFVEDFSI